ncbi:hypothetical protein HJC23_014026 [Cyclotella cryptica]|uniref:Phosphoglycerate mutase-like protein n=1 Tax=Cyclotella cryptica TaxID=29204 RepID=A0ABD3QSN9_9STRA|eukprot:CCRYP_002410-RA/>CCRYP_002410-RA protein AED:0.09 eAED:-0.11 QI:0/-1/0/1/-1/1/1/0/353
MMIQRRQLIVAFTMHSRCKAFRPVLVTTTITRRAATASSSSPTILASTGSDDPTFNNSRNYEWLKQSRPIRIYAKPLTLDITHIKSRKDALSPHSKIVHFQRHGQGIHNEIYAQWTQSTGMPLNLSETDPAKNPLLLPNVIDAPLTPKGISQCQDQYHRLASNLRCVERIIVSPLVRALQTAQLTFRDHLPAEFVESEEFYINGGETELTKTTTTLWTAHEGCREELGILLCNKRRPLSETKLDFPHVDFTHLPHHGEEDLTWLEYANNFPQDEAQRESMEDMSHRVYDFLVSFLRHLPEREVAVVGHSAWLHAMCNAVLDDGNDVHCEGDTIDTGMFGQAEIRTLELTFMDK